MLATWPVIVLGTGYLGIASRFKLWSWAVVVGCAIMTWITWLALHVL